MISKYILIVVYSAVANLILPEYLLEEKKDFEEEVCNAFFVAGTGATFCKVNSTVVALTIIISINMTGCTKLNIG